MDFAILDFIQQHLRTPFGDWFMVLMSALGEGGIIWIAVSLVLLCRKKTRRCGLLILITMALGAILNDLLLKNIIARVRPCNMRPEMLMLLPRPNSFSFMSGHTLSSFGAATVIFLHHRKWALPAAVTAVLIAFSRMYVYVHFPTDVLAGMLAGILLAVAVVRGTNALLLKNKRDTEIERNRS
ncbi:MAG: phosphatase PAP2 family protein [Clostridiales bacterium]|nr:phosphatase PAP2 family protein [Clostridiales bacterium]